MQTVTNDWEQTNNDFFTRESQVIISINRADGRIPMLSDSLLSSVSFIKSGDILSGSLTNDKLTFTAQNYRNWLTYDETDQHTVYENARVEVSIGFMNHELDGYDSIRGGIYYVTDVVMDSNRRKFTFTCGTILSFMTEPIDDTIYGSQHNAYLFVQDIITQANASDGVPSSNIQVICDPDLLRSVTIEFAQDDRYSLAEALQLIANACGCVMFVDRQGKINIVKLPTVANVYILTTKFQYEPMKIEYIPPIGNITLYYSHGTDSATTENEDNGGELSVTNPILEDETQAIALVQSMYNSLYLSRRRFKARLRFDPKLDIFDVIAVPNGENVDVDNQASQVARVEPACITSINVTYNGAWKGNIECVSVNATLPRLRIMDLERMTLEQLESMTINQIT